MYTSGGGLRTTLPRGGIVGWRKGFGEGRGMVTETYTVRGMTCGHCAASVSEEDAKIEGVTNVDVDLKSGLVKVSSTTRVDRAQVNTAVDEAGYELVTA